MPFISQNCLAANTFANPMMIIKEACIANENRTISKWVRGETEAVVG
jgi:hypothetical protein